MNKQSGIIDWRPAQRTCMVVRYILKRRREQNQICLCWFQIWEKESWVFWARKESQNIWWSCWDLSRQKKTDMKHSCYVSRRKGEVDILRDKRSPENSPRTWEKKPNIWANRDNRHSAVRNLRREEKRSRYVKRRKDPRKQPQNMCCRSLYLSRQRQQTFSCLFAIWEEKKKRSRYIERTKSPRTSDSARHDLDRQSQNRDSHIWQLFEGKKELPGHTESAHVFWDSHQGHVSYSS